MEIDELNNLDELDNDDILWSIEDDTLFQPCGLISHSSSNNNKTKSVFVTWNENYLLNYRFKKSKKNNRMEMTKVRIPLPSNNTVCHLRSIHMLEYNTLLLMSDGRVHCFGSIKSLHNISWLKGVRAFARTVEGFGVIRYDEDTEQLLLQVYMDLPSLGKGESTLQRSYDITYDEQNIFQCDWKNDKYTLLSVTVTQSQEKFMQCLFGPSATADKQLHIFSIAGHVFVLTPQDKHIAGESAQAYCIELLCIYATSVNLIRFLPAQNLCLIYLSCGSIDIWYVSQLMGTKQRQMYFTGDEWLDCDASSDNCDFYYTNGQQLVRLRFEYDVQLDDCVVHRCVKLVPGMKACTWVEHIEQLVCLSDNNIFYKITFSLDDASISSQHRGGAIADLTSTSIQRLRLNAQMLEQYEQQPVQLLAAIQREHEKQQLVAVARNVAWLENGMEAELEFRQDLPDNGAQVLLLHTARQVELDSSGIYATLKLKVKNINLLMHSSHWQVLVYHESDAHVHRVPTDLLLSRQCLIIIPLKKVDNVRLPHFTLKFVAFIELNTHINAILLPVMVRKNRETYKALFHGILQSLNLYNKHKAIEMLAKESTQNSNPIIQQKVRKPSSLHEDQIASICNASAKIHDEKLEVYFINSKLNLSIVKECETFLKLECKDVASLYHIKQHLHFHVDLKNENLVPLEGAHLKIMKLQHDIEQFYGSQHTGEYEENEQIHLESLLFKYNLLRNTVF